MKIGTHQTRGSVLMGSLLITALIGVSLITYLTIAQSENRSEIRSQSWNSALAVAEAGVEEALTQLNFQEGENLSANGWTLTAGKYTKQRTLGPDAYYLASIDDADLTIRSTGYARFGSDQYLSRTIQATVDTANTIFTQAIIAKNHIKFRAKNGADSYDSGQAGRGKSNNGNNTNAVALVIGGKGAAKGKGKNGPGTGLGNTGALRGYDKLLHGDQFGLACPSGKKNGISVDTSKVYGSGQVAPGGSVQIKNTASLGSLSWIDGKKLGLDPDRFYENFRFTFSEVSPPFTGGGLTPTAGKVDGVDYQYILDNGNYQLSKVDLTKPLLVNGDCVLYVTGNFKGGTDKDIVFKTTNSTLRLYCAGDHFHINTKNVVNWNVLASFQYYGLPKNKCVKIDRGNDFSAVIYAPRARVHLKGNGEFYGSVVGKCVHVSNDGMCHYDEALGRLYGDFEKFVVTSWSEL